MRVPRPAARIMAEALEGNEGLMGAVVCAAERAPRDSIEFAAKAVDMPFQSPNRPDR